MKRLVALVFVATLLTFSLTANSLFATNFYTNSEPGDRTQFGISFLKPNTRGTESLTLLTGSFLFSGQFKISDKANLGLILPLSIATINSDISGADDELGAGNILAQYKQLIRNRERHSSWWTLEFYLPTSKAETGSLEVSIFGDFTRFPMYYPEASTFGFQYANRKAIGPNQSAFRQFEAGIWVMFSSDYVDETELIFHYAYAFGLTNQEYAASLELTGQFFATGLPFWSDNDGSFSEKTFNQVVLGMSRVIGNTQPKLFYQIPLDNLHNDIIGSVLGLGVDIFLD